MFESIFFSSKVSFLISIFPGSIKKYGIEPDMATWGKGIANGFSFCALTGKKEYMELGGIKNIGSEKLFLISTTHGGETHALAAAMATIDEFEKNDVISHNHAVGKYLIECSRQTISEHNLADFIEVLECNWMPVFLFKDQNKEVSAPLRTLAMQEMIKRGVLFQGAFIPCYSHSMLDVDYFTEALNQTLNIYAGALEDGYKKFLVGDPVKPVFRKYI